ncbi:GntR family transcriptional regulator [Aeromicrobium sp. HA]|uniref:GntR family transcriptional regulator n=1 Tax=Aeromicrobium sp. HA TaxID=3009077 RepID=UPI0022AF615C|nr:GntR family transcriptional regulator [Aeromicrobium sp. HA]
MPTRGARPRNTTRADGVLRSIRLDILNGTLPPGSRLGFTDLGARYDVSTGVLREVLPRLVEQGLATSEPQLGYRVIDVSIDRLTHLTEARVAIEGLVTRQAIHHGDLAWEAEIVARHHALVRRTAEATGTTVHEDWIVAHEQFHLAILLGCPNPYLVDTARRLRSVAEVYRCWAAPAIEASHRDVASEHRELMEAAIGRDPETAVSRTEAHIRRTTDLLLEGHRLRGDVALEAH